MAGKPEPSLSIIEQFVAIGRHKFGFSTTRPRQRLANATAVAADAGSGAASNTK
jgi:hypothetical protein